jgi:DNA-binding NarL/FixJ family response regulator
MDIQQALEQQGLSGIAPLRKWYLASGLDTSVILAMRSRLLLYHFWNTIGTSRQKDIHGCCTTGTEALDRLRTRKIGIIIATESLEDMSGDEFLQQALEIQPDLATLLFVEDHDLSYQPSSGYKSNVIVATRDLCTAKVEFRTAFFAAIGRARYRTPSILPAQSKSNGVDHCDLSQTDRQLLELYAQGLTIREMSERLPFTYATTKTYCRNLLSKLGVNNRQKAIMRALEIGLLRR